MKVWKIAIAIGVIAVIALFWRGLYMNPRFIPTVLEGKPAMAFSAKEIGNDRVWKLEDLRGKVVLLNFWASWCRECRAEHENLLRIQEKFGPDKDFVMLGIAYQDTAEDARQFLKQWGSNYPHLLDPKGDIGIGYGVYGVPETFLIDRDGTIRCKQFGPLVGNDLEKVMERWVAPLLQGKELKSCQ